NLALLCSFHHRLVHEEGWRLWRDAEGGLGWATPDGRPYDPRPGPSPPAAPAPAPRALVPA
ncbi:MAG TPA: HNH endonuclease, partial [Actinomycetota bacterium]|nr:HNH endonuclease [Actinomycetota bacterium]